MVTESGQIDRIGPSVWAGLVVVIAGALSACVPVAPAPAPAAYAQSSSDFESRILEYAFKRFPGQGFTTLKSRPGVDTILVLVLDDSALVAQGPEARTAAARRIVCQMAGLEPPVETRMLGVGFRAPGSLSLKRANLVPLHASDFRSRDWAEVSHSSECRPGN